MGGKIDVVMCTYNSNSPYLKEVLSRIAQEIPVASFIAVDRFSSDGTIDKILEVFPRAKIIESEENLGRARKIGIEQVSTDFFAFVDSDVLLMKGWYKHTTGLAKNGVGAVACNAQDAIALSRGWNYAHPSGVYVSSKENVDSQRGFTYATLLRRVAVEDWGPEENLCAGEDHRLLRHVVGKDFLWLTSYRDFAKHIVPVQSYLSYYTNLWHKHRWNAAGRRYINLSKPSVHQQFIDTFFRFWAGIEAAFLYRNAFLIPISFFYCSASFYGYVNWKKDVFLQR